MFRKGIAVHRRISLLVLVSLGALSLAFAACSGGGGDSADALDSATLTTGPRTSAIEKNKFETPMRVGIGSEVTWVNDDGVNHNVIARDGGPFKSGTISRGDSFSYRFDSVGTFKYTCTFHPGMDGVIRVE